MSPKVYTPRAERRQVDDATRFVRLSLSTKSPGLKSPGKFGLNPLQSVQSIVNSLDSMGLFTELEKEERGRISREQSSYDAV
jgi:hypothetical protein